MSQGGSGGGGGGYFRFQVTGWSNGGNNLNPNKSLDKTDLHGNYHESSDHFQYPSKIYLNQGTQKILAKILQPSPPQQKSPRWKFQRHKNPSIIPITWKPEYTPPAPASSTGLIYWPCYRLIKAAFMNKGAKPTVLVQRLRWLYSMKRGQS